MSKRPLADQADQEGTGKRPKVSAAEVLPADEDGIRCVTTGYRTRPLCVSHHARRPMLLTAFVSLSRSSLYRRPVHRAYVLRKLFDTSVHSVFLWLWHCGYLDGETMVELLKSSFFLQWIAVHASRYSASVEVTLSEEASWQALAALIRILPKDDTRTCLQVTLNHTPSSENLSQLVESAAHVNSFRRGDLGPRQLLPRVASVIAQLSNLRTLDLSSFGPFMTGVMPILAGGTYPRLDKLLLPASFPLDSEDAVHLHRFASVTDLVTPALVDYTPLLTMPLTSLEILTTRLGEEEGKALGAGTVKLRQLELRNCWPTEPFFRALSTSQSLEVLSLPRALVLWDCTIFGPISKMPKLKVLNLEESAVWLHQLPSLGPSGIEKLVLRKCPNLFDDCITSLDLRGHFKSLKDVDLRGCGNLSVSGVRSLRAMLPPTCEVRMDAGSPGSEDVE